MSTHRPTARRKASIPKALTARTEPRCVFRSSLLSDRNITFPPLVEILYVRAGSADEDARAPGRMLPLAVLSVLLLLAGRPGLRCLGLLRGGLLGGGVRLLRGLGLLRGRGRRRRGRAAAARAGRVAVVALYAFALRLDAERRAALQPVNAAHGGQVVAIDRFDELRRDDEHQLGLLLLERLRVEERAEHRDVADEGNLRERARLPIVEEAGERERLPVAQLDARLRAPGLQSRNQEAVALDAVGVVTRRDFRVQFEPDV